MTGKSKKRRYGSIIVTDDTVTLICKCNTEKVIQRTERNVSHLLDTQAIGWYTCLTGVCLCPVCTIKLGSIEQTLDNGVHPWT
jgi:hypothetical protein